MCLVERTQGDLSFLKKNRQMCTKYTQIGINLSACLHLHISFSPGMVLYFFVICFFTWLISINIQEDITPRNIKMTPAVWDRCYLYTLGWIFFNKPHPSILLHVPDGTTRKVLILFLQEIKRDIIFCRAQLAEPRRREKLQPWIQAHLLLVITKLQPLLEYQGVLNYTDALALLQRMSHSVLNDWNNSIFASLSFHFSHPIPFHGPTYSHTQQFTPTVLCMCMVRNLKIQQQQNKHNIVVHIKYDFRQN